MILPSTALLARAVDTLPTGPLTEEQSKEFFHGNLHFSLNALYSQLVITMFFLGLVTMMVVRYSTHAADDPWWTKGTVVMASSGLIVMTSYTLFYMHFIMIENWGKYKPFLETDKSGWFPLLDLIPTVTAQGFFSYRAFRLTGRNWFILVTLTLLILTEMGSILAVSIVFYNAPNQLWAKSVVIPELLWLSAAMTADLIITISILYGLWNSRTGWAHTDRVIGRLIRMTLEAQVPPLTLATTWLIIFASDPTSFLASTFTGIQPNIYTIGLLYSLNSRINWKKGQSMTMNTNTGTMQLSERRTAAIMVDVETETYETRMDRPIPGVNRFRGLGDQALEPIDDGIEEWDDDEKTDREGTVTTAGQFDSLGSSTYNKQTRRTPTPTTPPPNESGVVVTVEHAA